MSKIPITKPYMGKEETDAVSRVLSGGWLVQGQKVREFECGIAGHEQVKYGCAVTSCTAALHLTMLAEGMGAGMDVLVPSFTFVATANAVVATGATPVLMDVDERTFNIDVNFTQKYIQENYIQGNGTGLVNRRSKNRLWGIVAVHQFGLCADMAAVNKLAKRYGVKVIEDAACALGAKIGDTPIGGFGNTACVSFHPRKSITTGEGGMILTNDPEVYQKAVELRNHGSAVASEERHNNKGYLLPKFVSAGFNYRMTDLQGAIGCEQLKKLDFILKRRQEIAAYYDRLFEKKSILVRTPYVPLGYVHAFQSYVCFLDFRGEAAEVCRRRNAVMERLDEAGVVTRQGTHAIHKLDFYQKRFGYKNEDLPSAERCDSLTVSLPVFAQITRAEQEKVCEELLKAVEE